MIENNSGMPRVLPCCKNSFIVKTDNSFHSTIVFKSSIVVLQPTVCVQYILYTYLSCIYCVIYITSDMQRSQL